MTESATPATGSRTEGDLRASVRRLVIELAPKSDLSVEEGTRLREDLEYHSLALLELAFSLEDEFDLSPIDEATARTILTVGAVEDHVVKELVQRGELAAGD
jgi:acyl carrier protein